MDRLTKRTEAGKSTLKDCTVSLREAIDRLADYEDSEEQGLLVRLPCKVGDKIYRVEMVCSMAGTEDRETFRPTRGDCNYWCNCNHLNPCDKKFIIVEDQFSSIDEIIYKKEGFGRSFFLTREEAEQALRERGQHGRD